MADTKRLEVKTFSKGDLIIKEGDPGDFIVFISSGEAEIIRNIGNRKEKVRTVRSGEIVGEMAVISREPRCATVVAAADTEVIVINPRTLEMALINSELPIVYTLIKQLVSRLRDSEKRIEEYLQVVGVT